MIKSFCNSTLNKIWYNFNFMLLFRVLFYYCFLEEFKFTRYCASYRQKIIVLTLKCCLFRLFPTSFDLINQGSDDVCMTSVYIVAEMFSSNSILSNQQRALNKNISCANKITGKLNKMKCMYLSVKLYRNGWKMRKVHLRRLTANRSISSRL